MRTLMILDVMQGSLRLTVKKLLKGLLSCQMVLVCEKCLQEG
jgi:hypothetical protein